MKALFTLLFSAVLSTIFAQSYVVTPEGLRSADNSQDNYLVLNVEGKTALELYNLAFNYINETYENPNAVTKGRIEGEYLRFKGYDANFIVYNNAGYKIPIQVNYQIELRFKDGKVRYEIITLDMKSDKYGFAVKFSGGVMSGYIIYKNNGTLFKPETKADIENYFNTRVTALLTYLRGIAKPSDW